MSLAGFILTPHPTHLHKLNPFSLCPVHMDKSSQVCKDPDATSLEKDNTIGIAGLKQTISVQTGQNSMGALNLESPFSPQGLDFDSLMNITSRSEHESQGHCCAKVGMLVMPKSKHDRGLSLEDNDLCRQFRSSLPDSSPTSRAMPRPPNPGSTPRTQKIKADFGYNFELSPVSSYHGKAIGKGALPASPFWDRKVSSSGNKGLGSATPGRCQPKPTTRGEASLDNSPTVPKFGDWDESNPSAADGFTQVFDQVREQKQNGGGTRVATTNVPSSHSRQGKFNSSEGCCCFRWGKR